MRFGGVRVYRAVVAVAVAAVASLWIGVGMTPGVAAVAATKKSAAPFSMWFRTEPNVPRKRDMKADKLNKLIGSDFNEMWMSKTAIVTANENATGTFNDRSETAGPDNLQLPEQLPAQYQEMMRTWLVHRGSCPVEYSWTDLGKSFWPRWIKKGRCGRSDVMSCSWPPGMSCIPSSIRVLNLLRWHCWLKNRKNKRKKQDKKINESAANSTMVRAENGKTNLSIKRKKKKDSKFRCLWIKVPYPVTEDCTCSCRKFDE